MTCKEVTGNCEYVIWRGRYICAECGQEKDPMQNERLNQSTFIGRVILFLVTGTTKTFFMQSHRHGADMSGTMLWRNTPSTQTPMMRV